MKDNLRFIIIFVATLLAACYVHELGHAIAGLVQGIAVIPTPLKEYVLRDHIEWRQETWISLGGVVATVLLTLGSLIWYKFTNWRWGDAVLGGIVLMPCVYTIRFLLVGRGHDGLEWQATQTALGTIPSGHMLDILMSCLFLAGVVTWGAHRGRRLGVLPVVKAVGLLFAGIMLLIALQGVNNSLFDRFFPETQTLGVPPALQSE